MRRAKTGSLIAEVVRRGRSVLGPAIGLFILSYFAYHVVHGDRGLLAWHVLDQKATEARAELAEVRARREVLEHRVRLLHRETLDPDLLDESVRRALGYGRPDEIIIKTSQRQP
ncbi:MAG: septum formation initiator family protein [Rhodospirillales bacterium]|nr:septum formation initiator family protein [Rhodospirillales bacterium]